MQIFVTDPSPKVSAQRLYNNPKRALKMITEMQQILACAQVHFGCTEIIKKADGTPFKTPKSRMNHPVVKWVCENMKHVSWLISHLFWLYAYYKGRKFKNVYSNTYLLYGQIPTYLGGYEIKFLNFAKADSKGLDFTHIPNVFEAYDQFLKAQGA